jgi:membrane-associated phospholipid phosphatase
VVILVAASGVAFSPRTALAVRAPSDSAGIVPPALDPPSPGFRMLRLIRADGREFFTRRTAGILLAGAALTGASLVFEDPDRTADLLGGRTWERVADVGNFYGDGATLGIGALALLAAGQVSGDANVRAAGLEAGRSLVYTFAMVGGLKVAVDRTRPDGGRYSFPSAHAAGAFAIAPVLSRRFGRWAGLSAYGLALAAAVGRLEDRRHYLSDVVFGAALGTSVGLAVSRSHPAAMGVRVSLTPGRTAVSVRF